MRSLDKLLVFGLFICFHRLSNGQTNNTNKYMSGTPTIRELPCNEDEDVKALEGFMNSARGKKTNDIINLITMRTNGQRQRMKQIYGQAHNGQDLGESLSHYAEGKKDFASRKLLNTDHAKNIKELFQTPVEFLTGKIHDNIKTYPFVIPTLTTATVEEVKQMRELYRRWYPGEDIRKWMMDYYQPDRPVDYVSEIAVTLLGANGGYRSNNYSVDDKKTNDLLKTIPEQSAKCCLRQTKDFFNMLLFESLDQISAVGLKYNDEHANGAAVGDHIRTVCGEGTSPNTGPYLAGIMEFAMDKATYFAKQIKDWVHDKDKIGSHGVSIIIRRCEIDLGDIKVAYKNIYKKELIDDVNDQLNYNPWNKNLVEHLINGNS